MPHHEATRVLITTPFTQEHLADEIWRDRFGSDPRVRVISHSPALDDFGAALRDVSHGIGRLVRIEPENGSAQWAGEADPRSELVKGVLDLGGTVEIVQPEVEQN